MHRQFSTHQFFWDGELVKQLDAAVVVSRGDGRSRRVDVSSVHVRLVSVAGPDTKHFFSQDAAEGAGRVKCEGGKARKSKSSVTCNEPEGEKSM